MISCRPTEHLRAAMRDYPDLGQWVDMLRRDRGRDLPDWPEWCFLPMAGWYALACRAHNIARLDLPRAGEVSRLAALGAWRYSQGIYRLDPACNLDIMQFEYGVNIFLIFF